MLNLCLHAGARRVDRDDLVAAPTPPRTDTFVPIPHHQLLERVETTLKAGSLTVVNQAHALSPTGMRYFGLLELRVTHPGADYALVLGIRNSHDKSFPAALVLGSGVFVCDNLAFSGEVKIARRHTVHIERDFPQLVERAVGQLGDIRVAQDKRIEAYKTTELSDTQAHDLVVRALDSRVIGIKQIPLVLSEWRGPRHRELARDGKTGWRLFNAFTQVLQGHSLDTLPARTEALHGLLDVASGVQLATSSN